MWWWKEKNIKRENKIEQNYDDKNNRSNELDETENNDEEEDENGDKEKDENDNRDNGVYQNPPTTYKTRGSNSELKSRLKTTFES